MTTPNQNIRNRLQSKEFEATKRESNAICEHDELAAADVDKEDSNESNLNDENDNWTAEAIHSTEESDDVFTDDDDDHHSTQINHAHFSQVTNGSDIINAEIRNLSNAMSVYNPNNWRRESRELRLSKVAEIRKTLDSLTSHINILMIEDKSIQTDIMSEHHIALKSILKPTKPQLDRLCTTETPMNLSEIKEHQVIECALQEAKCFCCDVQVGLSLAFIWLIMCSMPYQSITEKPVTTIIRLFDVCCLFIGIIGIWKAVKFHLYMALIGVIFNMGHMLIRAAMFIYAHFTHGSEVFIDIRGPFLPGFIDVPHRHSRSASRMWIAWIVFAIVNIAFQSFIIWNIRKALKAIAEINETFVPKRNLSQISL